MPIDRGNIDQQLQAIGESSLWWDQREFRDLPGVLEENERIVALARGKIARIRWLRRTWLIVLTHRRLVCLRSQGKTSWRQLELKVHEFTRVSMRVGPFKGRVLLGAGGQTYRFLVPRDQAYKLHAGLSSLFTPVDPAGSRFAPSRVVHRVIDHVLALPAVALGPAAEPPRQIPADTTNVDDRLQLLEREVEELREQVAFLEQLLRKRQHESLIDPGVPSH